MEEFEAHIFLHGFTMGFSRKENISESSFTSNICVQSPRLVKNSLIFFIKNCFLVIEQLLCHINIKITLHMSKLRIFYRLLIYFYDNIFTGRKYLNYLNILIPAVFLAETDTSPFPCLMR